MGRPRDVYMYFLVHGMVCLCRIYPPRGLDSKPQVKVLPTRDFKEEGRVPLKGGIFLCNNCL